MKYGNFYDLESLTLLNRHEGCACSIKECDVEKVNRLISRMREDRERVSLPTIGDVVTYTTRGGDYYPQAHIERGDDREVHICLLPQTPFCHENEKCTGYNTEGGPWVITGPELLLPDGIRSKQFRMWGHTGRHRNGAVLFHTFVRKPLYKKEIRRLGQADFTADVLNFLFLFRFPFVSIFIQNSADTESDFDIIFLVQVGK